MNGASKPRVRSIRLSAMMVEYLEKAEFLPKELVRIVNYAKRAKSEDRFLRLDANTAEQFRDEFTNQLARSGFGRDYEINSEGRLLEELIDKFGPR